MSATEQPHSTDLAAYSQSLAGRYRIERQLGRGGMATVYLAEDLKHERQVAMKVLHPELGAWLGAQRFLSEIRITARLQHPHILPLLDSGQLSTTAGGSDGLLYYVMPYVAGETLRARLTRTPQLPVADALRIAREVLSALVYAHAQGVIHRDIKPENILLGPPNAMVPPPALLADFGIARTVDGPGERLTSTGISVGTMAYMSPEQATGEREIDGRSDVYSLGCVLYEMLTGAPPFVGPNARAILAKALSVPARPAASVRPDVPPNVDAALATALALDPDRRFASAAAFAEALDQESVAPRPRHHWNWRTRTLVAATAGGALVVAAVAWVAFSKPGEALAMPAVRVQRFTTLAGDTASAYLAATLQQDVTATLAGTRSARVFAMDSAKLPSGFAVSAVTARTRDSVEVRLTVLKEPSGELVGTKVVRQPIGRTRVVPELATNVILDLVGSPRRVSGAAAGPPVDSIAYDLFLRGRYQTDRRTEVATQRAISLFRAAVARDSNFAEGWAGLTRALSQAHRRGYRVPGISNDSLAPLLFDASDRALDADSTRSYVWIARAIALRELEPTSVRSVIAALERAIALDSNNADAWHYLAVAWEDSLVPDRALDAWRRALRIDPTNRQSLGFMALHFMWARRYDSALAWGNAGKRIDPTHILIRQGISQTELILNDTARAADDFRAEIRVSQGPDEGFGWAGLADIAARQGDRVKADSLLRHALAIVDTLHPTLHEAAYLAWGHAAMGDKNRALRTLAAYEPRADVHFQLHLLRDPLLDPLRSLPGFRALLVRKDQIRGPGS